jgi:nicotinate-nucleotide adenylyltransferase
MARLAVADDSLFDVSDIESKRPGPSYTFDTIMALRATRPTDDGEWVWIIGGDTLPELATWHRIDELVDIVRIVTVVRPGFAAPDLAALRARIANDALERLLADRFETPAVPISSTEIRRRVRTGDSVSELTPSPVAAYIRRHGLYR